MKKEGTLTEADVIMYTLSDKKMKECIDNARILIESMKDRKDLHKRDYLERYIDILMGEAAEQSVIEWINSKGKYAKSAVDKKSGKPDAGHDVVMRDKKGKEILCSVKSSLSVYKSDIKDIIKEFTIATKKSEVRKVNIQVYFWLILNGEHRVSVPSNGNMAIIGWVGENDIHGFSKYATENRESPTIKLNEARSMNSLLNYIS